MNMDGGGKVKGCKWKGEGESMDIHSIFYLLLLSIILEYLKICNATAHNGILNNNMLSTLFSSGAHEAGMSKLFHKGPCGCRFLFQPVKSTRFDQ